MSMPLFSPLTTPSLTLPQPTHLASSPFLLLFSSLHPLISFCFALPSLLPFSSPKYSRLTACSFAYTSPNMWFMSRSCSTVSPSRLSPLFVFAFLCFSSLFPILVSFPLVEFVCVCFVFPISSLHFAFAYLFIFLVFVCFVFLILYPCLVSLYSLSSSCFISWFL